MTDQAFNPYEPPSMEIDEIPQKALGSGEYRIEKNTLVFREPCRLPHVCFWSGAVSDLTDCEFQIRVMPRWWAFVLPILLFGQQILVVPLMQFVMPRIGTPNSGLSPITVGVMVGILPGLMILLMVATTRLAGRIVTVNGSYNELSVRKRRRKTRISLLCVLVAIAGVSGTIWFLSGRPDLFIIGTLFAVIMVLIVGLRFRKPWYHIVGSLTKDGDIVISGLRPEFFLTLRQLQTIAFQDDEDRM